MRNFLIGLGGLVAGAALWLAASIGAGILGGLGEYVNPGWWVALVVGFLVMVGFPLVFWLILPLRNRLRKQGAPGAGRSWGKIHWHILVAICTVWWTLGFGNLIYALVAHYWPRRALT